MAFKWRLTALIRMTQNNIVVIEPKIRIKERLKLFIVLLLWSCQPITTGKIWLKPFNSSKRLMPFLIPRDWGKGQGPHFIMYVIHVISNSTVNWTSISANRLIFHSLNLNNTYLFLVFIALDSINCSIFTFASFCKIILFQSCFIFPPKLPIFGDFFTVFQRKRLWWHDLMQHKWLRR